MSYPSRRAQTRRLLLASLAFCAAQAGAQARDEHRRPPEPPPQAFDACKGKTEGARVEITTPHGDKLKATCTQMPNKGLFARPDRPPEGGRQPPDAPPQGQFKNRSERP